MAQFPKSQKLLEKMREIRYIEKRKRCTLFNQSIMSRPSMQLATSTSPAMSFSAKKEKSN
jgi:hypothetical protein